MEVVQGNGILGRSPNASLGLPTGGVEFHRDTDMNWIVSGLRDTTQSRDMQGCPRNEKWKRLTYITDQWSFRCLVAKAVNLGAASRQRNKREGKFGEIQGPKYWNEISRDLRYITPKRWLIFCYFHKLLETVSWLNLNYIYLAGSIHLPIWLLFRVNNRSNSSIGVYVVD